MRAGSSPTPTRKVELEIGSKVRKDGVCTKRISKPFIILPDPRFLWYANQHKEAKAKIEYPCYYFRPPGRMPLLDIYVEILLISNIRREAQKRSIPITRGIGYSQCRVGITDNLFR